MKKKMLGISLILCLLVSLSPAFCINALANTLSEVKVSDYSEENADMINHELSSTLSADSGSVLSGDPGAGPGGDPGTGLGGDPSVGPGDAPGDNPGGSSFETYNEIKSFDKAYIAIIDIASTKPLGFDPNTSDTVTINNVAPNRTAEIGKGMSISVTVNSNKATLSFDDPPGNTNYMYVDGEGIFCCTTDEGDYESWFIDENGQLYYNVSGTKYYFDVIDGKNSIMSTTANTSIFVFSGTKTSNGGSNKGDGTTENDPDAPVFTVQPKGYDFTTEGGNAEFNVEAVRTIDTGTTSDDITYQWYLNEKKIEGQIEKTLEISFTDKEAGTVCTVYCEATYNDGSNNHTTKSTPASYIISAGQTDDYLLFSDIHGEFENIAYVLTSYMNLNNNKLPKIVFATGDYCSDGGISAENSTLEQLKAIDAMLGGIDTYYLAGNHENSSIITDPEGDYNKGSGCILNDDVYIYTINYDEIGSNYSKIIAQVENFLSGIAEPKPVIFVAHAGIHMLEDQNSSSMYNIDLSDRMVDVLNKYGKKLNIFFFFGHNHSKGESEFYRRAGDIITGTYSFSDVLNRTQTLNFTYGHMGYLNTKIGGKSRATVLNIGQDSVSMYMIDSDGMVENMSNIITGAGGLDVPVVAPFEKNTEVCTILNAVVNGDEKNYDYEWYIANSSDTASSDATLIENESDNCYLTRENDIGKYIFCKVKSLEEDSFATTTATKIVEKSNVTQSSSSGSSNYLITIVKAINGSITSSAKSASPGTIVTIDVKADKGWTLETIEVTDKSGNEVPLISTKINDTYTFRMPSGSVIVKPTFSEDNTMLNFFTDVKPADYFYDSVLWAVSKGITSGVNSTHFNPAGLTTRAQMITLLWRAAGSPEPAAATCKFIDVNLNAYYYKAVLWAVEKGITFGVNKTKFAPNDNITRAQALTFIWRYEGGMKFTDMTAKVSFNDVAAKDYYYNAVIWAKAEGITSGITETSFASNGTCTRAQAVTFLYRDIMQ